MRSKSEIKDRLRQASFRYLKRILAEKLNEIPSNCGHNDVVALDQGRGFELRVCSISQETKVRICDARFPGCSDQARNCDWFVHKQSKEDIKAEWDSMLQAARQGERGQLAREGYGDLAAIMWVLDEDVEDVIASAEEPEEAEISSEDKPSEEDEDEDEEADPPKKPGFWNRLFGG